MSTIDLNRKVRVYWNVKRKLWSIQEKVGGSWLVVSRMPELTLRDARFFVSGRGHDRCRRLGKKVVHAYVEGLTSVPIYPAAWRPVYYNPFGEDPRAYFSDTDFNRVDHVKVARLTTGGSAYYTK